MVSLVQIFAVLIDSKSKPDCSDFSTIVRMETLGISLSEKPFYDIADHDLLDVWESDIGSVRTKPVFFAVDVVVAVLDVDKV